MRASRFLLALSLLGPGLAPAEQEISEPRPGELDPAEIVERLPSMPPRGITKSAVRERLGDPRRTIPAVGDPPISRWIYEEFTVYFEFDRVLHSVKHRQEGTD